MALDYQQVAFFLSWFLSARGKKITLCLDRTEWDFGKCQVNILMVTARQGAVSVPLYWELLDNKSGNSSSEDRIELMKKCVELLGVKRIGLVIGDREFVGLKWLKWLKSNGILFCMRMPRHHLIQMEDGRVQTAEQALGDRQEVRLEGVMVDGVWANVFIRRLKDGDLLYLLGTAQCKFLGQLYRKRWTIECCFQALKKRGFDLEDTHLKCLEKLKKLVALVSIAYAFCHNLGIYNDLKIKKIPVKNHGYMANSFFRNGLDSVRQNCKKEWKEDIGKWQHLLRLFFRWAAPFAIQPASG
ncbi:MAG TPA: IS4 family transposase [Saprospiraceae bacterium]|nr:IS4 family transposase [Saprospiraceae bacterium]